MKHMFFRAMLALMVIGFAATQSTGQTGFLQKVLLTSGDSVAINFSEVRYVTGSSSGARIGYGKPIQSYTTTSSYSSIVSESNGNLVSFIKYRSEGGTDTIALNPRFVKSASVVAGETKTRLNVEGFPDRMIVGGSFATVTAQLRGALTASAALNFTSTAAQTSADLTITLIGAALGDVVILGVPNASVLANCSYSAWVSAADTVSVRLNNYSSSAKDPASGTFKVAILK